MKIIFFFGHPAHFHLFINPIMALKKRNHEINVLIKTKDILEVLCKEKHLDYINILPEGRKDNKLAVLLGLLKRDFRISKIVKHFRPNLLIGSEVALAHVGKLYRTPSIILSEDDAEQVMFFSWSGYPFVSTLLSPEMCAAARWEKKRVAYNSYHELAYLHPNYFQPDKRCLEANISFANPYYIIRFSALTAYHDTGRTGITKRIAYKIIELCESRGRVYITSERKLEPVFEKHRININPLNIHHALYFADLFIGDSQTMTAEAAVLGTPALRFNDFVGKLGYLEELEHQYGLTYGIKTSQPEKLFEKIEELLKMKDRKQEWQQRRQKMLKDKIDVTAFMVWFIENYPDSVGIMKKDPDYQYRFK